MTVIRVNPDILRNESAKLLKYKSKHQAEMKHLKSVVNSLPAQWHGAAQREFVSKFNSMEYIRRNFDEQLEAYAELMKKTANKFQQTDNDLKNQFRNI